MIYGLVITQLEREVLWTEALTLPDLFIDFDKQIEGLYANGKLLGVVPFDMRVELIEPGELQNRSHDV